MQNDKKQSIITTALFVMKRKPSGIKTFNDGGLSRCSAISCKENVFSCMKKRLLDGLSNHYNAAKRLDIMLIGTNYDVFAADMYYHRACYNRFTYEYQKKPNTNSNSMPTRND